MVGMRNKVPHYLVYIPLQGMDHFIAYNHVTRGFYITKSIYSAEKFMSTQDAVESYHEFCETHKTGNRYPEYTVIGMNTLVSKG